MISGGLSCRIAFEAHGEAKVKCLFMRRGPQAISNVCQNTVFHLNDDARPGLVANGGGQVQKANGVNSKLASDTNCRLIRGLQQNTWGKDEPDNPSIESTNIRKLESPKMQV